MDEVDRAEERIEDAISDAIAKARRALGHALKPIGVCHWCESPVSSGRIFCSADCRDDYEANLRRR